MKIGIFDSGLGGLVILRQIIKILPAYDYVYLGDNARVPYGGRSEKLIYQFTKEAVDFLMEKNCLLVLIACNTATASALRQLQQNYLPEQISQEIWPGLPKKYPARKILGVIRPAVEAAIEEGGKRVGVIGTSTTVHTRAFVKELKKLSAKISVYQQAAPLLVPIIEEGELNWPGTALILKKYLQPLLKRKIDTLILGCTHYGLIKNKIQKIVGKGINIISEGEVTAAKLKDYLKRHSEIERKLSRGGERFYYVTDLNKRYEKLARFFLS